MSRRAWTAKASATVPSATVLGRRWPVDPDIGDEVEAAYRFLGVDDPATVVRGADAVGASLGVCVAALVALAATNPLFGLSVGVVVACLPALAARRGPPVVAALRRTRALGSVPSIFSRLVLRLRVTPSLERAVSFAGRSGGDRLSESLAEHARRARGSPETGLRAFAADWNEWAPAVERASSLLVAAADAPPPARERGCERALSTVLDATEERLARFGAEVRGPVTALYAFGVLLPLALVGVLPAARVAGLAVPTAALVALYDLLLPVGLLGASVWLLTRRPVAFPPPRVRPGHPDVPDRAGRAAGLGLGAGGAAATGTSFLLPWAALLTGVAVGVGVALVVALGPARAVQEDVRDLEAGLPDALALVGRRVAEGTSVERALPAAAEELPGATGELLDAAAARGERLGLDVARSFFGERGVLRDVPSRRARDAATLLTLAAAEGRPAGDVLVAAGDHLRDVRRVEREARRELTAVTGTLANTAVLFGPLVGGVTVAMVGGIAGAPQTTETAVATTTGPGQGVRPALLGRAVGAYVLVLAAELTALSTALERGLDATLVGYRVGVALPVAGLVYVAAVVAAGQVL